MTDRPPRDAEVLVVGAGSSGSVLAAQLAARGVEVTVLEAGVAAPPQPWWSLRGAFDPATSEGVEVALANGRTLTTRRGRTVGGSGAVNGCYWVRATRDDHADWVSATGDGRWGSEQLTQRADLLEAGPIPVSRDAELEPVSEAARAAASELGLVWVDDFSEGEAATVGLVPFNIRDHQRFDPAWALGLLDDPPLGSSGRLVTGVRAEQLVVERGRVVGVDATGPNGPRRWRADRVVVCAGSLGTALLLLRSGIGPAADLAASGRAVVADLPVGAAAWDHPCVDVPYLPVAGAMADHAASFMQLALHLEDPDRGGVVEILPTRRPYGRVTGAEPDDALLHLRVTLMRPRSRVQVRNSSGGRPEVRHGTLDRATGDLPGLCAAVAFAVEVARSPRFAPVVADWLGPGPGVVADHRKLAEWVAARVTTSYHLGGTAPMGRPASGQAVVDGGLRVIGVPGLWVADASVLPAPLRRGPAATAALLGAVAADAVMDDAV